MERYKFVIFFWHARACDTNTFWFVSDTELFPPRLEYLVIPDVKERDGEYFKNVDMENILRMLMFLLRSLESQTIQILWIKIFHLENLRQ